jgi:NifU-like protein involved in Fe-S cluster formation
VARFSEVLREHARYPLNQGAIEGADLTGSASQNGNPPFITLFLLIQDGQVSRAGFESAGCGVTTAICSVTTELLLGLTIEESKVINVNHVCELLGGVPPDKLHCVHVVLGALSNALNSSASQF